jgi:hypothetical protein
MREKLASLLARPLAIAMVAVTGPARDSRVEANTLSH